MVAHSRIWTAASNPKWLLPSSLTVGPHPFGHYRQKCGVDIGLPREYKEGPPHVLGEHGTRGPGACPRDTGAKGRARAFRARAQRELSRKTIRFSCASSVALCEGTASLRTGRPLRPYSQGRLCHAHFLRLATTVEKRCLIDQQDCMCMIRPLSSVYTLGTVTPKNRPRV